eukprot:403342376
MERRPLILLILKEKISRIKVLSNKTHSFKPYRTKEPTKIIMVELCNLKISLQMMAGIDFYSGSSQQAFNQDINDRDIQQEYYDENDQGIIHKRTTLQPTMSLLSFNQKNEEVKMVDYQLSIYASDNGGINQVGFGSPGDDINNYETQDKLNFPGNNKRQTSQQSKRKERGLRMSKRSQTQRQNKSVSQLVKELKKSGSIVFESKDQSADQQQEGLQSRGASRGSKRKQTIIKFKNDAHETSTASQDNYNGKLSQSNLMKLEKHGKRNSSDLSSRLSINSRLKKNKVESIAGNLQDSSQIFSKQSDTSYGLRKRRTVRSNFLNVSNDAASIKDQVQAESRLTTPDSMLLIWYIIMTLFNVALSLILFSSFRLTKCYLEIPKLYEITLWIEIILHNALKILSIIFFRYDLVWHRSTVRAIVLWRPYFIPLLIISIGPATLLPLYTYNFELCYDRNLIIGLTQAFPLQVAVTVINVLLFIYLTVIIRLEKIINKGFISDRSVTCLKILNKVSKIGGLIVYGLIGVLTILALFVITEIEYQYISIIEICQIVSLAVLVIIQPCLKL